MLSQPLFEKLSQLGLTGFRVALEEQMHSPHYADLSFEERLSLLVDIETTRRANNACQRRVKEARFALQANVADLDLSPQRGLKRALVLELAQSIWVQQTHNLLVLGATGTGKTYLACALGHAAAQSGFSVQYHRTSRFLHTLELARADGSYPKLLRSLARIKLLIFDDWLRDPLNPAQARDLLDVLDDRYRRSATLLATQVPVTDWHLRIPDPTISDAILDRLIHNAYRLELKGESMRKVHSPLQSKSD